MVFIQVLMLYINDSNLIYSNLPDKYCRTSPHEFISNSFHFYWTSFWFLLPFIGFSILLSATSTNEIFVMKNLALITGMMFYLFSVFNYNSMNQIFLNILVREELINPLLLNSINKYHPFVFYTSLILLVTWWLKIVPRKVNKTKIHFIKIVENQTGSYVFIIALTLMWGGWWAAQEGSWGGWWNWDPSEVFGLMLMLIYVLHVHINIRKTTSSQLMYSFSLWWWCFTFMYYFIQLNFDLVSHNFGTRVHQFVDSYSLFLMIIILIFLRLISIFVLNVTKNKVNGVHLFQNSKKLTLTLILVLSLLILAISFNELFINLLWTLLSLNILNFTTGIDFIIIMLLSILLVRLYRINIWVVIIFTLITNLSWVYKIVLITLVSLTKFSKLHTITWSWLILSIFYVNQSISEWGIINLHINYQVDYFGLKLNSSCVEHLILNNSSYWYYDSLWGLLRNTSNTTQLSFSHDNSTALVMQTLKSFLLELAHFISILDYNTGILFSVILLWFGNILKSINMKTLIVF